MKFKALKLLVAGLVVIALAPAAALATDTPTPTVDVGPTIQKRDEARTIWIDTYMPNADVDQMAVKLKAPRPNGRRFLWQTCDFVYQGTGRYSCGFRLRSVKNLPGKWAAVLKIEGERITVKNFRIPR